MDGQVVSIHIAHGDGERLEPLDEAVVCAGRGIREDRYFDAHPNRPERQFTLIEEEKVAAMNEALSLSIPPEDIRRNVVTRGIALNELVNREFSVGEVKLRGIELCEPCKYMANLVRDKWHIEEVSARQIVAALAKGGGIRAEILTDGKIRPGDRISLVRDS
jgi:MOSC domain-containing protein YiiM